MGLKGDMQKVLLVMTDARRQPVNMAIADAYVVVGALRLAMKHPGIGNLHNRLAGIALFIERAILKRHPGVPVTMPENMDEETYFTRALPALSDEQPLNLIMSVGDMWSVVTTIQLATRHPGQDASMLNHITHIGRQFEKVVVQFHPAVKQILADGWDERHDR